MPWMDLHRCSGGLQVRHDLMNECQISTGSDSRGRDCTRQRDTACLLRSHLQEAAPPSPQRLVVNVVSVEAIRVESCCGGGCALRRLLALALCGRRSSDEGSELQPFEAARQRPSSQLPAGDPCDARRVIRLSWGGREASSVVNGRELAGQRHSGGLEVPLCAGSEDSDPAGGDLNVEVFGIPAGAFPESASSISVADLATAGPQAAPFPETVVLPLFRINGRKPTGSITLRLRWLRDDCSPTDSCQQQQEPFASFPGGSKGLYARDEHLTVMMVLTEALHEVSVDRLLIYRRIHDGPNAVLCPLPRTTDVRVQR